MAFLADALSLAFALGSDWKTNQRNSSIYRNETNFIQVETCVWYVKVLFVRQTSTLVSNTMT